MTRLRFDAKVQEEIDSPTIIHNFTRLLKRTKVHQTTVERTFKVSLAQLKTRKPLYLDSIVYSHLNIGWECVLEPSASDSQAYDFTIRCLEPPVVINKAGSKVSGTIAVTVSHGEQFWNYFTDTSPVFIPSVVSEEVFEKTCVQNEVQISMSLNIDTGSQLGLHFDFFDSLINGNLPTEKTWKKKEQFRRYWKENMQFSEQEMKLSLAEIVTRYFARLLSEATMKSSFNSDWMWNFCCISNIVMRSTETRVCSVMAETGVYMLIAKLLAADFSECYSSSIRILQALTAILVHSPVEYERNHSSDMRKRLSEAFDEAFINVIDKFYDPRYRLELLAFYAVYVVPQLACSRIRVTVVDSVPNEFLYSRTMPKIIGSIDALLPFLDIRTQIAILQPFMELKDWHFSEFFNLTVKLSLKRGLKKDPYDEILKRLLEVACENLTNPFYDLSSMTSPLASIEELETLRDPDSTFIEDWCKRNIHLNPGFIYPATATGGFYQLLKLTDIAKRDPDYLKKHVKPENHPFIDYLLSDFRESLTYESDSFPIDGNMLIELATDDINSWGTRLNAEKEQADELFRSGDLEDAGYEYSDVMEKARHFLALYRGVSVMVSRGELKSDSLFPWEEINFTEANFRLLNLINVCLTSRVAVYMENGEHNEALADSVLAINELQTLINGHHIWFQECSIPPSHLPKIKSRLMKLKLRRIKILIRMEEWIPALHNAMDLLKEENDCPKQAVGLYYHSLVKYSSTAPVLLYPIFCVSCQKSKGPVKDLTKFRCVSCRHPFCSETCYQNDRNHKEYCPQLTKLCKSKNFKEFVYQWDRY